ncbi:MAG: 2-amino-4-hydroxy-6-hydroxymethyldihydropteridine diphosphokinase [Candidatus Schekmanbacteria bacterium RBG_16_38_10]|uniref:2-amino-4-hydroxy-6-hydroxymethyldihydropteridine diphosphokinase n=1 Tax=Candidatus Schekmanbacteria bacterium RBG_16_38_10 TaxID=1817879 RepID=A0A1F7RQE7_9BACT|nr:MAG: 2-amino-4-hydroxy-6-hydroxymethyldihydropteridine diphosphokinase [Candidatus Schekmanbacteria bacterium RBG_16_38_10]
MKKSYISIGSNLGDRTYFINTAINYLTASKNITILRQSSIYETEPEGKIDQPKFLNCIVELETKYTSIELLHKLQEIENKLGRVRAERWGPRTLDMDILFYGNEIVDCEKLTIPHPLIAERRFVLEPLSELIPDFEHPISHKKISELKNYLMVEQL